MKEDAVEKVFKHLKDEKYTEAYRSLEFALKKDSRNPVLKVLKALILVRLKKPEEALRRIEALLKTEQDSDLRKLIFTIKVEALIGSKDYGVASRLLSILLKKFPQDHTLLEYKGVALLRMKKYASAAQYLEKAHKITPSCKACATQLAIVYLYLNRKESAKKQLQNILKIDGGDPFALRRLFLIYLEENNHRTAFSYISRLINVDPDSQAHVYKGKLLLKFGRKKAALESYRSALRLLKNEKHEKECDYPGVIYKEYIELLAKSSTKEALKALNKGLARYPGNRILKEVAESFRNN